MKACFSPFGGSTNLDTRYVQGLRRTYHRLENHFGHPMELLGDVSHVESHFFPLGDMLVSVQDRCTVCAKRTIGSEIILDAIDGTPR